MDVATDLQIEKSLRHYIEQAWHIVEPARPLIWNWHLTAICQHLQAVTNTYRKYNGYTYNKSIPDINYLWFNLPPRHTKSLIVSVFWPTWEWGPQDMSHMQYIFASYADELSTRDSIKRRRIIQNLWYKRNWGDRFKLVGDQNRKTRFENDHTGYMISTSVGGIGTGEGGDRIIVDDAHNVKKAESDVQRNDVLTWWDDTMSTRLNDDQSGAYVGVMQRVHAKDLSGHVYQKMDAGKIRNHARLILPGRYEKLNKEEKLKHPQTITPLKFKDPRTKQGEALDKQRETAILKIREKRMTEYTRAGQIQQRPAPRGGGMFKVEQFKVVDTPGNITQTVRYWDKAGTEDGGKRTAGVKIGKRADGKVVILDVRKGQWGAGRREEIIKQTANLDGKEVEVWVEQEPGSGGKESAENTVRNLMGFVIKVEKVTGAKETRAEPYAAYVETDMVRILNGVWNMEFIDEHENFPMGEFCDQVDAAAGGFNKLAVSKSYGGW